MAKRKKKRTVGAAGLTEEIDACVAALVARLPEVANRSQISAVKAALAEIASKLNEEYRKYRSFYGQGVASREAIRIRENIDVLIVQRNVLRARKIQLDAPTNKINAHIDRIRSAIHTLRCVLKDATE